MDKKELLNEEIAAIRSLMDRVETPHTDYQAEMNKDKYLTEAVIKRNVKTPNEFIDIMDSVKTGWFVTLGYVTTADFNIPTVKRKNPLTGRQKAFTDWDYFTNSANISQPISGLINLTTYNMVYQKRSTVDKQYVEWKASVNAIRSKYNLPQIVDKGEKSYTTPVHYGENELKVYRGKDETKNGNFYYPQNTCVAKVKSVTYAINSNGDVVEALTDSQIKPFLKSAKMSTEVNKLMDMKASQETIDNYVSEINSLNFKYRALKGNSILFLSATMKDTKEKILYINDSLVHDINGVTVNTQDLVDIVKKRYNDALDY